MNTNLPVAVARGIFERAKLYLSGNADFPQITRIPDGWEKLTDRLLRTKTILKVFMPEGDAEAVARAWIKRVTKGCKVTGADLDQTLNEMIRNELEIFYKVQEHVREIAMSDLRNVHPDDFPLVDLNPRDAEVAREMASRSVLTSTGSPELLVDVPPVSPNTVEVPSIDLSPKESVKE